jgi:hypothetical protein
MSITHARLIARTATKEQPMTMPSETDTGDALRFLATTDLELGQLQANKDAAEYLLKHHVARLGLESGEKSAAAQNTQALASEDYHSHVEALRETSAEFYALRAQRKTAELTIDVWRSYNANRRVAA